MKYENLEHRLIDFAALVVKIVESMPDTRAANHLAGQLLRSGTSPALNYGEARAGESIRDFLHKMRIALKELRETFVCLKVIYKTKLFSSENDIMYSLKECNELISIFVASCKTVQKKADKDS